MCTLYDGVLHTYRISSFYIFVLGLSVMAWIFWAFVTTLYLLVPECSADETAETGKQVIKSFFMHRVYNIIVIMHTRMVSILENIILLRSYPYFDLKVRCIPLPSPHYSITTLSKNTKSYRREKIV